MTRRYHLHLPGIMYVLVALVTGMAAMNSQNNLLFWIFGVMVASVIVSGVVSGAMMLGLRVRRIDPQHGAVGEPLVVRYEVRNRNRLLPAFNIHLEERPVDGPRPWQALMAGARAWIMHVGPGETVHGEALLWPDRRGEARFDQLRVWTTFPFGLIKKSVTITQPQHTLIYPQLYELGPRVLSALAPEGVIGMRISRRSGAGDDYYGLREHRPGDSMRHIAWKQLARRDELISIERTRPSPPKIRVVVSLRPADGRADADAPRRRTFEERAISLAASLLHAADRAGYDTGLSAPGTSMPEIPIRRGHWHVGKMMAALAAIDLAAPRRAPVLRASAADQRVGVVVVHPDRIEPLCEGEHVWDVSARQIESLTLGPIGWDPSREAPAAEGAAEREVAA